MNTTYGLRDKAIIKKIGLQIKEQRLQQNLTQQALSEASGVDRITISKLENGHVTTLLTIIQIVRALKKLHWFDEWLRPPEISPLKVAEMEANYRLRASKTKPKSTSPKKQSSW